MPETDAWTIRRLLAWTAKYLEEHGSESPRLEADLLLAEARGCQRLDLYMHQDEEPPPTVRTAYRELVRRRAEGTPVAYLLGRKEFYTLTLVVSPDVLIPRPDTEDLVIGALDLIKKHYADKPVTAIDLGTGSGAIAVATTASAPKLTMTAVDISPAALDIARQNAERNGVADRVRFLESDLYANCSRTERFDFALSNPPYIRTDEMPTLNEEVRKFEPHLALEAGPRGTEFHERIIADSADHLTPGGFLLMEMGYQQNDAVRGLIEADGRYELLPSLKDSGGHWRVARARLKG